MPKYRNYSSLDRANEERAQVQKEFKEGWNIREVCRLLNKPIAYVRRAMRDGQILAVRMHGLVNQDGSSGKRIRRTQSWYSFPRWQFEEPASQYLPVFLLLLFAKLSSSSSRQRPSVEAIYETARNYLMHPNPQMSNLTLLQILSGKSKRKIRKALELVYPDFQSNRKQNPRRP